jgi:hypothetical protein
MSDRPSGNKNRHMETTAPEVVAARAFAVVMLERLIRDRTAPFVWVAVGVAALLFVGAAVSDGVGAVIVGLFALVAATIAATLFIVRGAVLRVVRRVAGGRDYERARPVIDRHIAEVERARGALPLDTFGMTRVLWMARRPAGLRAHVQDTATTLARAFPSVVADVRHELNAS